jgi:hypothetical protein
MRRRTTMRQVPLLLSLLVFTHTAFGLVSPWKTRDTEDALSRSIAGILSWPERTETPPRAMEERLLALMEEHASEEDKGIIYASIAQMYSHAREDASTDDDMGKQAAKYARLALAEPLDPRTACSMYSLWGHVTSRRRIGLPPAEFAAARRRAVLLYLLGLKCALDNGAPVDRQHVPGVGAYQIRGGPDSPELQAAQRKHAREMEARERAMLLNELAEYRYLFVINCVFLYDTEPYDSEELRAFSEEILIGHEDVAEGIMRKLAWWHENKRGWQGPPPRDSDFPPDVRVGADATDAAPEAPTEGEARPNEGQRPKG